MRNSGSAASGANRGIVEQSGSWHQEYVLVGPAQQGQHLSTGTLPSAAAALSLSGRVSSPRIRLSAPGSEQGGVGEFSATRVGHPPVRRAPHGRLEDCPIPRATRPGPAGCWPGRTAGCPAQTTSGPRRGRGQQQPPTGAEHSSGNALQEASNCCRSFTRQRCRGSRASATGWRPSSTRQRASYQRSRYQAARSSFTTGVRSQGVLDERLADRQGAFPGGKRLLRLGR